MSKTAIEMARDAGATVEVGMAPVFYTHNELLKFAELVRADERKKLADQTAHTATYTCGACGVSMRMEQPAPVQGWKLVPLQPTVEMVRAYDEAQYSVDLTVEAEKVWAAMVAAAPQAQPAREWVGLTENEMSSIVNANTTSDCGYDIWVDGKGVAQAIEAKLREKNQ